jgi:CPA1 family monovalent cation:H+ antiporter
VNWESAADEAISRNLEQFLLVLSVSLSVATLSRTIPWFRKIPYTLLLVIVGMGLAFVEVRLVNLSPELILEIFLPPLIFEAAWNVSWRSLKASWLPIVLFAVVGVIISILGIAFSLNQFGKLALPISLLIGAALATTDPIAVLALFKELGASKKLTILLEGESLFNDGIAIVIFVLLIEIFLGTESFSVSETVSSSLTFVGIGIGLGCIIGFGISLLTQRFDLLFVEQSLTLISAYGTYLITEELGGSGVIGVVTVGIILGNFGSRIGMNPKTRSIVTEFWEFVAFFVNSIIFLLIGDQVEFAGLGSHLHLIVIATAATLAMRFIGIYGLSILSNWLAGSEIGWRERIVLWWGGLRGFVSIALALSVPEFIPARQEIIDIVFGVVLFTLLVQGLTIQWVLKGFDLIGDNRVLRQECSQLLARQIALYRVLKYLDQPDNFPDLNGKFYQDKRELVIAELNNVEKKLKSLMEESSELQLLVTEQFEETLIDIEAETYAELIRVGRLDENLTPLLTKETIFEENT